MKILFILSGGLDSTTALYLLRQKHEVVETVTFDYGQRHVKEIKSAQTISKLLKIPHTIINIKNLNQFLQGSSLTSKNIKTPHGHYQKSNMKKTIVPNRNAIMINIAAGYAISKKIHGLGVGVHAGDHYIYPDCRPEFIDSQAKTLSLANECDFKIFTPFINQNKAAIVKKGLALGVPFELTWTCYEGGKKPCNKCGSCTERLEAFKINKLTDPLSTN
ncbi:MAG: 7-cyano-7-deazaguanine synthase QueC [Candidatus Gracilibacteria bacterium]|jgi:7-cyano-7-deazaguanine synthase